LIIRGFYSGAAPWSVFSVHFLLVILMTGMVAMMVCYYSRKENVTRKMFLLLIWSCIAVSLMKLTNLPDYIFIDGLTSGQMFLRKYLIDIIFVVSGIVVSRIAVRQSQSH
jgi:hypothetical protein